MQIKVEGSQNFVSMILAFHKTLWPKVLVHNPHLKKLESTTIYVYETTRITDMGISFVNKWEMLINHYFTKNNPKQLYEVYGHELAHFIAFHGDGNISHGGTWVNYMKTMELPVRDRVHIAPELAKWANVAVIKCGCGTQEIQKSRIAQRCGRCKQSIKVV